MATTAPAALAPADLPDALGLTVPRDVSRDVAIYVVANDREYGPYVEVRLHGTDLDALRAWLIARNVHWHELELSNEEMGTWTSIKWVVDPAREITAVAHGPHEVA